MWCPLGISSLLEMGEGSRLGEKKEDDRTWQKEHLGRTGELEPEGD